jgi:predicted NBD/HSP70 family sugar kinase
MERVPAMNEDSLKAFLQPASLGTPSGRIVRALGERGSLSAAQIARLTGLARSTVSTAVAELRRSGLIFDAETPDTAGAKAIGRPGTALTLNPDAGTCIGVHLALDELRVAVADVSHSVISEQSIPLPQDYGPDIAARTLKAWIARTYADNGLRLSGLLGIGVSVSAPVSPDGTVHRSSIVPAWADVNVVKVFGEALGALVIVDNESNCSAIAEHMWGAAQGEDSFVLFKINAGIGGAIMIDRRIVKGLAGGGGEFGHISLDPLGPLCRCGNRGCLEVEAGDPEPAADPGQRRAGDIRTDPDRCAARRIREAFAAETARTGRRRTDAHRTCGIAGQRCRPGCHRACPAAPRPFRLRRPAASDALPLHRRARSVRVRPTVLPSGSGISAGPPAPTR